MVLKLTPKYAATWQISWALLHHSLIPGWFKSWEVGEATASEWGAAMSSGHTGALIKCNISEIFRSLSCDWILCSCTHVMKLVYCFSTENQDHKWLHFKVNALKMRSVINLMHQTVQDHRFYWDSVVKKRLYHVSWQLLSKHRNTVVLRTLNEQK